MRDVVASPQGVNKKFESLSRDMTFLFTLLSFSRGILAFGDLWLLSLGGFLMIAVRLAVPVMIALALDRNLAQKITYPFTWGVIVLTLVWPIVAQLIRAIAYMGGNLAMSLDASDYVYQWDPQMMSEIMVGGNPYHTVILAILILTIAGLSLWMSPMIAYKVTMGQIYESVSSTVSGWVGALVGAGIELYSSSMAASISNQAERTQIQGHYQGEVTRAGAAYEGGKLNALANQIRGITGAEATRISSVGSIYGGLLRSLGVIDTEKLFSNVSAAALAKLNIKDIAVRNQQAVADMNADRKQQSEYIKTDQAADTKHWWGSKILRGADWFGGAARTLLADSNTGRQTVQGRIAGTVIELGGAAWGLSWQHQSIQERAAGKLTALDEAFNTRIGNQELASLFLAQNQGDYFWDIVGANERRALGLTFAEITGA